MPIAESKGPSAKPQQAAHSPSPASARIRGITRRYYALQLTYAFAGGFLFAVYPLFLRSRGLDQLQINSVLAVYFVATFLTDVPTGAFADAMGRRWSFLCGCGLRVIGFGLYFFVSSYPLFLLAESIDGVGTTFCNGAIDAWGVDALDRAGFVGLKDRLFSRIAQLMSFGWMVSAMIGTYVADVDIAWPWLLGAAGYIICAIVGALLMREHSSAARPRVEMGTIVQEMRERVATGLRRGFNRRGVLLLSIANAIMVATWAPYWLQWPQVVNDAYGMGIWVIGWVYCFLTIGRLIGAEAAGRLASDESGRSMRVIALGAAAAALLFAAGLNGHRPNLIVILLFVMNLCTGASQPMIQSWLNEQIESGERATLLSFNSTFATLGGAIGLLILGYVADRSGIPFSWQVAALISLGALPCYIALRTTKSMSQTAPAN